MMACNEIHTWTFSGLVGAFLDLSIAYLLLCGSTLAFFASKFLNIFKLNLPCACSNGLFGDPSNNRRNCIQRLLVDTPINRISSVQMSVKNKFPFDSILMEGRHLNVKFLKERECREGFLEMEGESSCSSFTGARLKEKNELVSIGSLNSRLMQKGVDDFKGKGVLNQRSRYGVFRRRRRALVENKQVLRRSSSPSPFGGGWARGDISQGEESSGGDGIRDDNEAHAGIQSDEGPQHSFRWNDFMGESKNFGRDVTSASDVEHSFQQEMGSDRSDINSIRVLEQALEEEHTARAALYQELEKERSAAASAADEAMAMILRLQKEKASVEMEAKQYQRMIEEKSAYDEEEMNILKEILVRREREVHFLEKEVEAYRMTTPRNENSVGLSTQTTRSLSDSSEDPELMLQQISEYIDKKEMVKNMKNSSNTLSVEKQGRVLTFEEGSPPLPSPPPPRWHEIDDLWKRGDYRSGPSNDKPESISEYKHKFQEKGLLSVEEKSSDPQGQCLMTEVDSRFYQLNEDQEHNLLEKTIIVDEEQGKNDNAGLCQGMAVKTGQTGEITIGVPHDGANLEKHGNDADQGGIDRYTSISEAEPTVLDVHVIDDRSKLCNQGSEEEAVSLLINTATDRRKKSVHQSEASGSRRPSIINDHLSTSRGENQSAIRRSMSDMRSVSDKSQGKKLPLSDMRRNSMSSVDCERSKLESEVGWLRERLKIVQEGREKLSFSVEHREREKLHLQLLEDIAKQLKEIRHLTEPVKSVRQASLPPSSSKVSSKKRRCRSVSWGVHGSS